MITIVEYNAGNISSVYRALRHLGIECRVSGEPCVIASAERLLFPGVGNAASAMAHLNATGVADALRKAHSRGTPILGICLGSQIILTHSDEGDTPCLDLLPGDVKRLPGGPGLKVPHMGWNSLSIKRRHPVLADVQPQDTVYFVHSYYTQPCKESNVLATTKHGAEFAVALGEGNLIALQFHPEKSGGVGLAMLRNFAKWEGAIC